METIATDNRMAVLGMGATGLSCARYLRSRQRRFAAFDSAMDPGTAAEFRRTYPQVPLYLGEFEADTLRQYSTLLVSPGISLEHPAIAQALAGDTVLLSDIDLLLAEIDSPVVAITGSNGKTTVTTLVGLMAEAAGMRAGVGGNIGTPALDLIDGQPAWDLLVLELSSFQLERSGPLGAEAATILNVSPDHMDRYSDLLAYQQSKQRIYRACRCVVYNRDDKLTYPLLHREQRSISFGLDSPDLNQFGLRQVDGETWLARGPHCLLSASQMKLRGRHNLLNGLAALALGEAVGLDMDAMLSVLQQFPGLPHRCEWLGERGGVAFFNDSKGTNTGATLAAVSGLSQRPGDIVLIAGGQGKDADFSVLQDIADRLKGLILMGEAAADIATVMQSRVDTVRVKDMAAAVDSAVQMAGAGDSVLLSPACASFDMYRDYQQRGEDFIAWVERVLDGAQV